jgi:hypothetical protein
VTVKSITMIHRPSASTYLRSLAIYFWSGEMRNQIEWRRSIVVAVIAACFATAAGGGAIAGSPTAGGNTGHGTTKHNEDQKKKEAEKKKEEEKKKEAEKKKRDEEAKKGAAEIFGSDFFAPEKK